MSRWIAVTVRYTNEEALVNLDNVDMIVESNILFNGTDGDGVKCKESHTELTALIAQAERNKA